MKVKYRFSIIILLLCLFMLASDGFCQLTPAQKHKRQAVSTAPKKNPKKYEYIKNHDMNHDGKIDAKDRLMWLNSRKNSVEPVLVSKENEDLLEIIDTDNNGSVEQDEIEAFYRIYDTNNNGTLENSEINAAIDE